MATGTARGSTFDRFARATREMLADLPPAAGSESVHQSRWQRARSIAVWLLSDPGQRVSTALLVASLGLVPVALYPANSPIYAGIANPSPTVHTYTVAVLLCGAVLLMLAPRQFRAAIVLWAPLLVWLLACTAFAGDLSPRTLSGLVQLALGMAAFAVGTTAQEQHRNIWFLSWALAAVAWLQLVAITAALLGFPLREVTGPQALDILGRATGLTAHPGELSKLLFFCGMGALTLPQRSDRERWFAWLTLGAVFVGISLAQSRTVLAAVIALVFLFVLLDRAAGRWHRRHLALVGTTLALGLASLPWLIQRFLADPSGGARQHVAQIARGIIADHWFTGVGVNSYVAVVGRIDRITETGVPVHNIFLLSAAELGIFGALLLWLPFAVVAARAARSTLRTRGKDIAARVLVSALPGILLMGMTGWGLMLGPYFLLLALVIGYFGGRVGADLQNAHGRR